MMTMPTKPGVMKSIMRRASASTSDSSSLTGSGPLACKLRFRPATMFWIAERAIAEVTGLLLS